MGMEEGMASAMGQIDEVLADLASFAAGSGTELRILSDTQVRVSRIIRGTVEQVWQAHHDPDAGAAVDARPRRLDHAGVRGGDRGG